MLWHFRNISFIKLNELDSINYIQGKNGSGKTNILYAIYTFFYSPKSFTQHLSIDLYKMNVIRERKGNTIYFYIKTDESINIENQWVLSVDYNSDIYDMTFSQNKITRVINKKKSNKFNISPVIFFKPEYKFLLFTQGSVRRAFIDELAKIFFVNFKDLLRTYNQYEKKRISILESENSHDLILNAIEKKLSIILYEITKIRYQSIEKINAIQNTSIFPVKIHYVEKIKFASNIDEVLSEYIKLYTQSRNLNKFALISESKFDCEFFLYKVDKYINLQKCSMGEKQSAIVGLFITQAEYFEESILLLDEPFVHLDNTKKEVLINWINKIVENQKRQVFITEVID